MQNQKNINPIDKIIHKLISNNNPDSIQQQLVNLAEKKNLHYEKIISHVKQQLSLLNCNFEGSFNILLKLLKHLKKKGLNKFIQSNIFNGFKFYWINFMPLLANTKIESLKHYDKINNEILLDWGQFFYNANFVQANSDKLIEEITYLMVNSIDMIRGLKLLTIFKLESRFTDIQIADCLVKINFTLQQVQFYIEKKPGLQKLLVDRLSYRDHQLCTKIIKKYKWDPFEFKKLIWQLQKKSLSYNFRTYLNHFVELKYISYPKYLAYFAVSLIRKKKYDFAYSLLEKYNLYDNELFEIEEYKNQIKKPKTIQIIPNTLLEHDTFGPTQSHVLKQEQKYLELSQFDISQQDVFFVNNIDQKFQLGEQKLLNSDVIGFDCEFEGGSHPFINPTLQTIQLSTPTKIFIYDYNSLKEQQKFQKLIQKIFHEGPSILIGHGCSTDMSMLRKNFKFTGKEKNIIDTQTQYLKIRSGFKSGLNKIVFDLFQKNLSKYEQCSNWRYRPLRKAQLHYAGMDAFVLIKIMDKLKKLK